MICSFQNDVDTFVDGSLLLGIISRSMDRSVLSTLQKEIGDEKNTRFWDDWWVHDKPLKEAYPGL